MDNRKKIRLRNYDYRSNGYYFVTVVTRLRKGLLEARTRVLETLLRETASHVRGVFIDTVVVMPNHIHCIVILESSALPLGEVIRRFKAKSSHFFKERLWQANYYEHVIRNETALDRIREYIMYNPELEIFKFEQFYQ